MALTVEADKSAGVQEAAMLLTWNTLIYSEGGCFCPKLEAVYWYQGWLSADL